MSASLPSAAAVVGRRTLCGAKSRVSPHSFTSAPSALFTSTASASSDAIQSAIAAALAAPTEPPSDADDAASSAASAAALAALSADYVPRWRYQPSSSRHPSRGDVLRTYHALLRLVRRTAQGQQQLWAKQRGEHWQGAPKQQPQQRDQHEQQQPQQQAGRPALQLFEYSDKWLSEARQQYRAHQHETDQRRIAVLHADAMEYRALLQANIEHSREVYAAGWGMQQATKAHVANTARRVGLQVTESRLDREVEAELRAEAQERGEGSGHRDETAARLEAVERRRKKEVQTKSQAPAPPTTVTDASTHSPDQAKPQ